MALTYGDIWRHKYLEAQANLYSTTHYNAPITNTLTLGTITPTSVIDLELLRIPNKNTYDDLNHAKSNTQSISPHVSRYSCTATLPNQLARCSLANGI